MIFSLEPLEQCWHEIYDMPDGLAYKHWLETKAHQYDQKYAPMFDRYNSYAKAGWFLQFTVRDAGRLIGFAGVYLTPSMHTQAMLATEDTWYLLPEYRKGWNAIKFYRHIEDRCRELGAEESTLTVPDSKERGIHTLLLRLDYKPVSMSYSKSLVRADSATDPLVTVGELVYERANT